MTARSESSSPRASLGLAASAALVGAALFAAAWGLIHVGPFDDFVIVDTPVYEEYGSAMTDGQVPYRDFGLEYPPGALPVFLVPELVSSSEYVAIFDVLMLLFGVAAVGLVAHVLAAVDASPPRVYASVALAAASPLLLGTVVLSRYDLWPALLSVAALAALVAGRERLALGVLAAAVAAKLYPAVLVPIALAYVWKNRGRREALAASAVFVAVVAAAFVPFAILAPDGLVESFERQAGRPLQIESLGASVLLGAHQAGLYDGEVVWSHGSQNLGGALADRLADASFVLQALAVVAVWIVFARGRGDRGALVTASAAAVVAFVAFGKVLSPQFLIWLVPLVPLVGGTAGLAAGGLLAGALLLTHAWFPSRYWDVVALEPVGWLVVLRDVTLVALFAVLLAATRRGREPARNA